MFTGSGVLLGASLFIHRPQVRQVTEYFRLTLFSRRQVQVALVRQDRFAVLSADSLRFGQVKHIERLSVELERFFGQRLRFGCVLLRQLLFGLLVELRRCFDLQRRNVTLALGCDVVVGVTRQDFFV